MLYATYGSGVACHSCPSLHTFLSCHVPLTFHLFNFLVATHMSFMARATNLSLIWLATHMSFMSLPTHMSFLMPIDLEHTHVRQIYAQYTHTCTPKYILVTYMYMSTFHTPYRSLFSFFYRSRSLCKCTGLLSKSIDHSKRWVRAHCFAPPFHVLLGIFSPFKKNLIQTSQKC